MALALGLRSGALSGVVSGNLVHCAIGPLKPGSAPPAGKYYIQAGARDPIYGEIAVRVPWSGSGGGGSATIIVTCAPTNDWTKTPSSAPIGFNFEFQSRTGKSAPVYILSSRPIPGQRCLVFTAGFDALIESLRSAGGAEVTIS